MPLWYYCPLQRVHPVGALLTAAAHSRELQYPLAPVRLSLPPGGRDARHILYFSEDFQLTSPINNAALEPKDVLNVMRTDLIGIVDVVLN